MRFSRQVHDCVRLKFSQGLADGCTVGNVGLHEAIAGMIGNTGQRLEVAGIGQLVEVKHLMLGVIQQMTNQCRANKAGAAGDQDTHRLIPSVAQVAG